MKIKYFVAIALVIFMFSVGSILALGLLQKMEKTPVIIIPDNNAIVDTKKNLQQNISSVAEQTTTQKNTTTIVKPEPTVVTKPAPQPAYNPPVVRRRVTRAS